MKQTIQMTINGQRRELLVDPQQPLLWSLRDDLGMTGTKYGCGKGLCGCCTVHLNGVAVRSCQMPTGGLQNAEIRTIEGVGSEEMLHPVQQAWEIEDVAQCGYCQAGQIMSAVALLDSDSSPSDEAIDVAMDGNLCRCATYKRIRKAIHRAVRLKMEGASS
ncbi:2Fe-2S iron-sulfur cluster-binding protein [Pelagicoccus sp. SDUM812003]|uniref:(2Fe-2S)-binding protein n=1 Tax=Pelagicoccus sp. SDUM812003 TaxID=3041267 RepID=UPI00280D33A4|nr:2Fe-2S iron-sulfur cluster-binding protein [Pelagicoccus sp. SDUM812003]MDQ8204488.1 (2Fe-2S)-binding protein [Pelagicoccus sp. SDUM812003]